MVSRAALTYLCFVNQQRRAQHATPNSTPTPNPNQLGDAERSVLHLARRSLAYKVAKLV